MESPGMLLLKVQVSKQVNKEVLEQLHLKKRNERKGDAGAGF